MRSIKRKGKYMLIEKIGEGATIEQAFENAKLALNAPFEAEIKQEIIQQPKKKFFGIKTEPAKVKVWYEIPDPKPAAKPVETKPQHDKSKNQTVKENKPAQKPEKKNENKPAPKQEKKQEQKSENKPQTVEEKAVAVPEIKMIDVEIAENDATANYLKALVKGIGIEKCELTLQKEDGTNEYVYNIDCGKEDGTLIGRRGETLDAIQYLLRLSINKGLDEDKHRKVSINVGNYRAKRNDTLKGLAEKSARQVLKYGRNVALEPMNPYERRIIHTAVQGIEGVTSHSVGSDSNRKVIITLEEGVEPTNPSHGGFDRRRDSGRSRGGRGGFQKKEAYKPAVTREPRKDSAGSLYGKIEIPSKSEEE